MHQNQCTLLYVIYYQCYFLFEAKCTVYCLVNIDLLHDMNVCIVAAVQVQVV